MLIFVIFIVGEYSRFYSVVLSLSRKISTVLFQKLLKLYYKLYIYIMPPKMDPVPPANAAVKVVVNF